MTSIPTSYIFKLVRREPHRQTLWCNRLSLGRPHPIISAWDPVLHLPLTELPLMCTLGGSK